MSRIRINELARELEVKPGVILDALPKVGVTEKKTHSSSIEVDQAEAVRRFLGGGPLGKQPAASGADAAEGRAISAESAAPEAVRHLPAPPEGAEKHLRATIVQSQAAESAAAPAPAAPAAVAEEPVPVREIPPPRVAPKPLRPPLAPSSPGAAPPAPPAPRDGGAARAPAVPGPPPRPAVQPGQILGPRQPLPPGVETPRKAVLPGQPARPPAARPAPPATPAARGVRLPGGAPAQTDRPARPLVGQPAPRPVVPPQPDVLARLQKSPGPPAAARPGMPQRGPVPGQPIYRGPIRPGQPLMRGPGAPGSPATPPAGRRRGQHPTRLEPPAAVAPAAPTRRHQTKPGARAKERERDREGTLQPTPRKRQEVVAVNRAITVSEGITVKELSEKLGIKASLVIRRLVERKIFATINQALDARLAEELAKSFGASTTEMSFEEESTQDLELAQEEKDLVRRPPVVTVMGHVDHGKTSLLDAIRESRVAEREAGGITQHIGAYHVEHGGNTIVFIDTPGHEAFTRMRARGAAVTDIVILVVAADDGVMPQTLEAMDHARAAKVPIIVAINKVDRPDANPERVKQQLSDRGLMPEDWGGDTVMVPVSAKAKQNIELLLEMVNLVAEMQDLRANPGRPAVGTVLEAQLDRGRGPVATVLVQNGTLRVGDFFICGSVFGRVRAMFDDRGEPVKEAGPSMPVEVLGLENLPEVGDTYQVVTDTVKAKQIVMFRESKAREQAMAKGSRFTLDRLHEQLREGESKELNIILKADVGGSAEVVSDTLQKLSGEKVRVRVIHSGVGAINESDVLLATASNAIIVGFNVRPERSAMQLAEQERIDVRLHTIIYELTDEIKRAMTGLLEPVFREVFLGRAEVREVFRITKVGTIGGCYVNEGVLKRDCQVRLLRDNVVVHTGKIGSLKRFKDDASEVKTGFECGVGLAGFNDLKPGDVVEAFVTERVAAEAIA